MIILWSRVFGGSFVAHWQRIRLPVQKTQVWSLGWKDSLEKEMATHSSILAWEIPWTEEPDRLQSTELQRVQHDWESESAESLGGDQVLRAEFSWLELVPLKKRAPSSFLPCQDTVRWFLGSRKQAVTRHWISTCLDIGLSSL